jgi:hypothetical protein
MTLPDTQHVSLRDAIIWIAYGNAKPLDNLSGDALWLSQEKAIADARAALWSALGAGHLEASAIGQDQAPALIGKHEWQFLFGRSLRTISAAAGWSMKPSGDGLYVKGDPAHKLSMRGVGGHPRFRDVTVPRSAILSIWPPRVETHAARVGRPSIMNEIDLELDRWIAGGFPLLSSQMTKYGQGGQKTIIGIARALEGWAIEQGLKSSADDEPAPRTIENRLRDKLRQALEAL